LSRIYSGIPNWIYTKGEKSSKENLNDALKVDAELIKFFCEKNECSVDEFKLLLEISPKDLKQELDMLEQILKSRKSKNIDNK
jgi:hypothetical protein